MAKRLAKLGDPIMGGVGAFVPEHFGKRPRACIQSDADFGSGAGTAERRPAAVRRLAATLSLGCERTAYPCERYCRARRASRRVWRGSFARRAAETSQSTDAERQERPLRLDCTARTMMVNRCAFAASSGPSTRQTSQPGSSAVIARCTAAGYRWGRRRREAGVSGGSGWSRRTPSGLPWS